MVVTYSVGHCLKLVERLTEKANNIMSVIATDSSYGFNYIYTYKSPKEITSKIGVKVEETRNKIFSTINEYNKIMNIRTILRNKIMEYNLKSGISALMAEREFNNELIRKYRLIVNNIEMYKKRNSEAECYSDIDFSIIDNRFTETSTFKKETLQISVFNDTDSEEFSQTINELIAKNHEISDKIVKLNEEMISFEIIDIDEEYVK